MSQFPRVLMPEKADKLRILHLYSEDSANDEDTRQFWDRCLINYCIFHERLTILPCHLENEFMIAEYMIAPSSLEVYLAKYCKINLVLKSSLCDDSVNRTWRQFLVGVIGQYHISSTNGNSNEHVFLPVLSKMWTCLLQHSQKYIPLIVSSSTESSTAPMTLTTLMKEIGSSLSSHDPYLSRLFTNLSVSDTSTFVDYLLLQKKAVKSSDGTLIKFASTNTQSSQPLLFTEAEIGNFKLTSVLQQVDRRIEQLTVKMTRHQQAAAACISSTGRLPVDKAAALVQLKLKKAAEGQRSQLQASQLTLSCALLTLEQAQMNAAVLETMVSATAALQDIRAQHAITETSAEDILEAYQEEADIHADISGVIAQGRAALGEDDDEDLLAELNSLSMTLASALPLSPSVAATSAVLDKTLEEASNAELIAALLELKAMAPPCHPPQPTQMQKPKDARSASLV